MKISGQHMVNNNNNNYDNNDNDNNNDNDDDNNNNNNNNNDNNNNNNDNDNNNDNNNNDDDNNDNNNNNNDIITIIIIMMMMILIIMMIIMIITTMMIIINTSLHSLRIRVLRIQAVVSMHDDVIKWERFPQYWPFVRGIHRSPMDSPHKGPVTWALKFSASFDIFNDISLNKWWNKQSSRRWFDAPGCSLWRHCSDKTWRVIVTSLEVSQILGLGLGLSELFEI